jgi:hypothetical protein
MPKAGGRQRPLGIAALEDRIVQQAVVIILNKIYEFGCDVWRPEQITTNGKEEKGVIRDGKEKEPQRTKLCENAQRMADR